MAIFYEFLWFSKNHILYKAKRKETEDAYIQKIKKASLKKIALRKAKRLKEKIRILSSKTIANEQKK